MKILFLAPDINLGFNMNGGAGTHMRASVLELRKRGCEVIVAVGGDLINTESRSSTNSHKSNKSIYSQIKKIVPSEVKKTIKDYNIRKYNRKILEKVSMIIKENNFDVLYERSGYGYSVGQILSKRFNLPHILETDVIMLDLIKKDTSFIFNRYVYRKLEYSKYHSADTIVVQSEYSVAYCKKYWSLTHDEIYNKDLGITIKNEKTGTENIKNQYNIEKKFVVGFVGYFMPYQNIPLLLEAAKAMLNNKNIVFLLVGGGSQLASFQKYADDHSLSNIIFTGLVDKSLVKSYYDIIDLAVIPDCAHHMYPVKFLEYANNNLPIVIPRYDVFKEFFESNIVFKRMSFIPKSSSSLIETLDKILTEKRNLYNYSSYTSKYIRKNKTWEQSGEKLYTIISETLNKYKTK
jgi:glycosyltransferase involved in cell wall biosynthesis